MNNEMVRLLCVEIYNFKNVGYGKIDLSCNKKMDMNGSDILGLYGQNGSGKTAFIQVLSILKNVMMGEPLSDEMEDCIKIGSDSSTLKYDFYVSDGETNYKVIYKLVIGNAEDNRKVSILEEELSYAIQKADRWLTVKKIMSYKEADTEVFRPKVRQDEITGKLLHVFDKLRLARLLSRKQNTSFIFSEEVLDIFEGEQKTYEYWSLIPMLYQFANINLFVVDNRSFGLSNANLIQVFNFRKYSKGKAEIGRLGVRLEGTSDIPEVAFKMISEKIEAMNIILCQLIPGLTIGYEELGRKLNESDEKVMEIELVSIRSDKRIPLRYESDGIKKIISVLDLICAMYNHESIVLAIDELDSGIYEYLLGEILDILDKSGKGQMIFTSHNLRPLEKLNKESLMFTTTNPQNRYIRLEGIKKNNNMRNLYYHDIVLGGQKECIYEPTSGAKIRRAFRKADHYE